MAKATKSTFKAEGTMGKTGREVVVYGGAVRGEDGNVIGLLNVDGIARSPLRVPYFFNVGKANLRTVKNMGVSTLKGMGFAGIVTDEQTGKVTEVQPSLKPIGPYLWSGAAKVDPLSGAESFRWGTWRVIQGRPGGGLWIDPEFGNVDIVTLDKKGYVRDLITPEDMGTPNYVQLPFRFDLTPVAVDREEWCKAMEAGLKVLKTREQRGPSWIKRAKQRRVALPGVTERRKKVEGNPRRKKQPKRNPKSVISRFLKGV